MANLSDIIAAGGAPTLTETSVTFSDVTTGNASTTVHGFLPKLSGITTDALKGDGTWGTVSGGSTLYFPFYKAAGTVDNINLVSGTALPFFNASGTAKNVALIA
jgi:thiamine monophosphate kinase